MYDRAHDGFTTTLDNVPWMFGCALALVLAVLTVAAITLAVDLALGTLNNLTKPWRIRRSWRRTGRTPTR